MSTEYRPSRPSAPLVPLKENPVEPARRALCNEQVTTLATGKLGQDA